VLARATALAAAIRLATLGRASGIRAVGRLGIGRLALARCRFGSANLSSNPSIGCRQRSPRSILGGIAIRDTRMALIATRDEPRELRDERVRVLDDHHRTIRHVTAKVGLFARARHELLFFVDLWLGLGVRLPRLERWLMSSGSRCEPSPGMN
jgi:hypothetical protein